MLSGRQRGTRTNDEVDLRLAAAHGGDDDVQQVHAFAVHQPAQGDDGHAAVHAAAGPRQVRPESVRILPLHGQAQHAEDLVAPHCYSFIACESACPAYLLHGWGRRALADA